MGASINIALPAIGTEFATDALTLSWISSAFLLAAAMFLVPLGRFADIHGRKRLFAAGALLYTLSSLLCAAAASARFLIAARTIQGLGGAMVFSTNIAILMSIFPAERRGAALGFNVAAVYLGLSLGPFLGGLLTEHLGWRSIFELNAAGGVVLTAVVTTKLPGEWAEARGEPFDWTGSSLYCLALAALMYGVSILPGRLGAGFLVFGALSMIVFVRRELSMASPILDVKLFRGNRVFALSNLAAFINYAATFAVGFLLSLYLQYVRGLGPQAAGSLLVSQPVLQTVVLPFAGWLSDRIEPRFVASTGMGLTVAGLVMLSLLNEQSPLAGIIACLALLGCGFGLFSSPNTNAVMSAVGRREYGVASAILGTMRLTGQAFSMGIAMMVLSLLMGKAPIAPAYHGALLRALRTAFGIFALLCVVGTFASAARGTVKS